MAKPLSPAAQAVRTAVLALLDTSSVPPTIEQLAAAAICAAADQVVPETASRTDRGAQQRKRRAQLLAIAAELEGRDG